MKIFTTEMQNVAPMSNKTMGTIESIEAVYKGTVMAVENNCCPLCMEPINVMTFRDKLSEREYAISGMCQSCQDNIFS